MIFLLRKLTELKAGNTSKNPRHYSAKLGSQHSCGRGGYIFTEIPEIEGH